MAIVDALKVTGTMVSVAELGADVLTPKVVVAWNLVVRASPLVL
jgi:hypothetical protein